MLQICSTFSNNPKKPLELRRLVLALLFFRQAG